MRFSKSFNFLIMLIICVSFSFVFCFNAYAGTNVNLVFGDNDGIRNANEFEWLSEDGGYRLKNNASLNVYDRFYLGWQKLPAKQGHKDGWYYFDENTGLMKTGWLNQQDKTYFLSLINDGSQLGVALNGWWLIDGNVCHLDETNYFLIKMIPKEEADAQGIKYNDPTDLLKSLIAKGINPFASNVAVTDTNKKEGPVITNEGQVVKPTASGDTKNSTDALNNVSPDNASLNPTSTQFVSTNRGSSFGDVTSIRSSGDFVWEHDLDSPIWRLKVWTGNKDDIRYYTGWQKLPAETGYEGGWYHFDPQTGIMDTGWLHENGKSYFFGLLAQKQNLGRALKGWWLIDGKVYHFNETSYELDAVHTVEEAHAKGIVYQQ